MQSNPGIDYQNYNGINASYTYDSIGMRTSKTVNRVEKRFYYNGMYILNEGDGTDITATNFVGLTGIEGR